MSTRRVDFRHADFDGLVELWNEFYPERYHIDRALLKQQTVDSPLFDWGASLIQIEDDKPVAFVAVKRSAARLYSGPDVDNANLNSIAFKNVDAGIDLLAQVKSILRSRGITRLVFGQDSRHFFPGCPMDVPQLCSLLMVEGFVGESIASDLERDLDGYTHDATAGIDGHYRMLQPGDYDSMTRFFQKTFPGRWRYDISYKCATEGISNCVYGLLVDGEVEGFALLQNADQKYLVGGAVWRRALGDKWASLGPIGISEHIRGKGAGRALLANALTHLQSTGTRRTIIDWTNLVDFYGREGFEVTRQYKCLHLPLEGRDDERLALT